MPSSLAFADLPGGAKVTFGELRIRRDGQTALVTSSDTDELKRYFNLAHCTCSNGLQRAGFVEDQFAYELRLTNVTTAVDTPGSIWTGVECSIDTNRSGSTTKCVKLVDLADLGDLASSANISPLPVARLIEPLKAANTVCDGGSEGTAAVWVGGDGDSNGVLEYWESKAIDIDTVPPSAPTDVAMSKGEGAIRVTWKNSTTRAKDLYKYQFLCAVEENGQMVPARATPSNDPAYQSASTLCDANQPVPFSNTAPTWATPTAATYICGEASSTASDVRLSGLKNGVPHQVVLLAIDRAGNATGVALDGTVSPEAVVDFWEDIQGDEPEGGFCLIATAYGDDSGISSGLRGLRDGTLQQTAAGRWLIARYYQVSDAVTPYLHHSWARGLAAVLLAPLVAVGLLWHLLTLPGLLGLVALALWWRRRAGLALRAARRRTAVASALTITAALLIHGGVASAQSVRPYWEDDAISTDSKSGLLSSTWHVGVRVGMYTPAIDGQLSGQPYRETFGDYSILPILDVERVAWNVLDGLGQITVGVSGGFTGDSGTTYVDTPENLDKPRAERMTSAEKTRFRLIPLALSAGFRLTYLDERLNIPLVPYVRGGLAYYLWWIEAPDGGVARACMTGGTACDEEKGRGGSLGVVASVGLAIRAERIDPEAAAAMREGGIQHAGFYAELQGGKVNDFGIGNKLSVGDVTWFAGVDFEF